MKLILCKGGVAKCARYHCQCECSENMTFSPANYTG